MSRNKVLSPVMLLYGNQPYLVEQEAEARVNRILKDAPRDFAYHRFDAEELLKPGAGGAAEALDSFQLACDTPPFLCERYVVRLDHLEAVKSSDRSLQSLQKQLDALMVTACKVGEDAAWALEEDLLPGEGDGSLLPVGRWLLDVESEAGGPPVVHLAPVDPEPRFLLSGGAGRRLVGLKEFLKDKLKGKFRLEGDTSDTRRTASSATAPRLYRLVERLIAHPPEGLHLLLTAVAGRDSDISKALFTAVKSNGEVEKFITYDDYNPTEWVQREARERGLTMNRALSDLLVHLVGADLARLAGELDKLALSFPNGQGLDEDSLVQVTHGSRGGSLFLITERLGHKQLSAALGVLDHFLEDNPNEHPMLVGILARYFRQLIHLNTLEHSGIGPAEVASHLKLPPFIVRKLSTQSQRFTPLELEAILRALASLDVQLKQHSHLVAPLLRELVHGICQDAFRRPGNPLGFPLLNLS
ncbi:MAG: DNA polymerase III subunit delta [Deltaproteobacteria bacterium]|nr:DNA polymerase III subunit delta [Deltaproteobacteria bacterium]